MEEINLYLDDTKESMEKALKHTAHELTKIRAGKALPSMLDGLMVNYYGTPTPIAQVATINTPDARTIIIKPWERSMLSEVEKAIKASDLNINPQNDGELVRLVIPALTEERRKDLVKQSKNEVESGKVRVRAIRKDTNEALKKLLKDGAPEDAVKAAETKVQTFTDSYIKKLDDVLAAKEQDIMTI
jgi:ribosome recycling factor